MTTQTIKRVARAEAQRLELPGRDWYTYITPRNSPARNVSIGLSVFPAGSRPEGHVHPAEEETIFVISGRGRLVTPEATAELEPGVSVLIPSGIFHATESDGPEPLELVCFFSPPVIPGSYERRDGE
jgi:quercetin dioxygenase-like cupin family protein